MTDIFLSYTERDRDTARRIAEALGSAGWSVWWDRRIPAGETWRSVLEHALEDMRCMIVLWSTKSIKSEWVCEEATEGRRLGKLMPVMIEAVRPPAGFREIQAADLTGWDGSPDFDGLRLLLSDLENVLGKPEGRTAECTLSADRLDGADAVDDPDPPYNTSDLPRPEIAVERQTQVRWPLRALAGGLLVAGTIALFGLLSQPQPDRPSPVLGSANSPPEITAPPIADAKPEIPPTPAAILQPKVPPDASAVLTSSTSPRPIPKTQPEPVTNLKRSDATSLSKARCADFLLRIQLGETLSEANQSKFNKEC